MRRVELRGGLALLLSLRQLRKDHLLHRPRDGASFGARRHLRREEHPPPDGRFLPYGGHARRDRPLRENAPGLGGAENDRQNKRNHLPQARRERLLPLPERFGLPFGASALLPMHRSGEGLPRLPRLPWHHETRRPRREDRRPDRDGQEVPLFKQSDRRR